MKAVILLAGMGSRLAELTAATPKSLLPIGDSNALGHMIGKLTRHGVHSMVIVCGHMQPTIEQYLSLTFPDVEITILRNPRYRTTNTAYSLLVAREQVGDETFIKLDGDVVFDEQILAKLVAASEGQSYACVDRTAIDAEVIKVRCADDGVITSIGNQIPVASAAGESIGIERIDKASSAALFSELHRMMEEPSQHQAYYEVAYDSIIRAGEPFLALDITGLSWVEIDTSEDYELAKRLFGSRPKSTTPISHPPVGVARYAERRRPV